MRPDQLAQELYSSSPGDDEEPPEEDTMMPICSVLNIVIDYKMMTPTRYFEPQEDATAQKVPVMRVFGPILRRDLTDDVQDPTHSACLYIHNAFPYMLARPAMAGPDASGAWQQQEERTIVEYPDNNNDSDSDDSLSLPESVNWDSVDSVQSILPTLTESLEAGIHTLFQDKEQQKKPPSHQRVIRKITVVLGRGFYTYCPGAPAPFLRVEYYDPSLRWKVKRVLERGLEGLPPSSLMLSPGDGNNNKSDEPLQFHCYEAHIPYTMQFFKDYNLAGMSYIHVGHTPDRTVRFRGPLPKRPRQHEIPIDHDCLFLESNTPDAYQWEMSSIVVGETEQDSATPVSPHLSLQQSSQPSSQSSTDRALSGMAGIAETASKTRGSSGNPLRRETSCPVEVDISVEHILNVQDVLTEKGDDNVHWRAVPSLREIWQEERRRMSKLVDPEDNFLLLPQKTSQPGTKLAVEGMQRLVRVTDGLEESFQRALRQIIQRHAKDIDEEDKKLQKQVALTPSHDETIDALSTLGTLFEDESDPAVKVTAKAAMTPKSGIMSMNSTPLSQEERFQALSQSYYERNKQQTSDCDTFEMSQRVDRGDGIITEGDFHSLDDTIDPETLTPYEDLEDNDAEEQMDEEHLERVLGTLATQMEADFTNAASLIDLSQIGVSQHASYDQLLADSDSVENDGGPSEETALERRDSQPGLRMEVTSGSFVQESRVTVQENDCISLRINPPKRGELTGDSEKGLFAMHICGDAPNWMGHLSAFNYTENSRKKHRKCLFLEKKQQDKVTICLTRPAPSMKTITSWAKKQRGKPGVATREDTRKRRKVRDGKESAADLPLDGNSRKLLVTAASNPINNREVEEVQWLPTSQHVQLSATQDSATKRMEVVSSDPVNSNVQSSANPSQDLSTTTKQASDTQTRTPFQDTSLEGMGNQGGKLWVAGGGELKAKTRPSQYKTSDGTRYLPSPVSVLVIEVHVQCRTGRAGINDAKTISMTPDPGRDKVSAVVFVYGRDPGGGEPLQVLERCCLFVPVGKELDEVNGSSHGFTGFESAIASVEMSMPKEVMGLAAPLSVECVRDERQLLLRVGSIVRWKDPDMLLSWDTQGLGIGYLIERGVSLGKGGESVSPKQEGFYEIDLARLLGRTPTYASTETCQGSSAFESAFPANRPHEATNDSFSRPGEKVHYRTDRWKGSGLGTDWDEKVGAGAASASINGRVVFAVWKIIAEEVKHPNASYLPAIVSSVLGKRIPAHDNLKLSQWYGHNKGRERWRTIHHKLVQATACLLLFDALDIIGRSGEAARLSGVEFSQSFPGIRGSQYKVEGVLLRALQSLNSSERGSKRGSRIRPTSTFASPSLSNESTSQTQSPWKARRRSVSNEHGGCESDSRPLHQLSDRSYFFYSPSLQDTNRQEALEAQALTLEPQSGHHRDPIVVCDFTALYPSLVIAYNLCYSTCAGRLDYHSTRNEMRVEGKTTERIGPFRYSERRSATVFKHHFRSFGGLDSKIDRVYSSPTGSVYVAESVVKGVLPQVLDEMLSTRAMLKKAAKLYKRMVPDLSPSILRQLEARQLALKYVANVTYGYTSATFSGRCAMPLLADTIVECGRRTLTNAINLATKWGRDHKSRWSGCDVIYGDTDSVFVKLPGRSVQEAFEFGELFCKAVTASNPPPVQLKLEKVYLGAIMQTKKKYCGMKFDSKDQQKPTFEAKGLETIRRDQCALTQKVLRNSLVTLFRSGLPAVKEYLYRQWSVILSGQIPVSDFVLTGRVRSRYRGGKIGPVQAVLARRLAEADPGRVVRHKERISYVIVATPGITFRLKDCVLTPMELLEQWDAYTIHSAYYIEKHLNAALQRCLSLAPHHVDVHSWYKSCPKPRQRLHFWPATRSGNALMISAYFGSDICSLCKTKCAAQGASRTAVCSACRSDFVASAANTLSWIKTVQNRAHHASKECSACNLCWEDASTFAEYQPPQGPPSRQRLLGPSTGVVTPLANCSCIDCPKTYERHMLREAELEAVSVCKTLGVL